MINKSERMHMIQPESKGYEFGDDRFGAAYMPEFTTAREFADAKIKMLHDEFCIHITDAEVLHLHTLKTENEINAAVKGIINKYWE